MAHRIVKNTTTRHRDLVGRTVVLTCACGTTCKSKGGFTGAWSAFDKHVKRAEQKETK